MYIIALNGSPNKAGNTAFLLNEVLKECEAEGAETEFIHISEILSSAKTPFCKVCSSPCNQSCYKGTELEEVFDKMIIADAVVIGSPVYFGSVSAQLKAFFDKMRRLRSDKAFVGKPAAAVVCGFTKFGGEEMTVNTIHNMMLVQGMSVVSDAIPGIAAGHFGVCAQAPAQEDERAISRAKVLAKRLVWEAGKM